MSDKRADLEKQLTQAKSKIDELSQRLSNSQRETRVATERQQREQSLATELDQITKECAQLKKDNERMSSEVAQFPTETQVLKLERRVESLKDAINKFETEITARRSAVDAYRARRDKCVATTTEALEAVRALCIERKAAVDAEVEAEAAIHSADRVQIDFHTMLEISNEREETLAALYESREIKSQEDNQLTAKLVDLQGLEERDAPIIDSDAAKHAQAITDAWQVEQQALLKTYDKLRQVNREQEYHIGRGTHVKREDSTPYAMYHEVALSSRQGHLATQLNSVNEQLQLIRGENAFTQKRLDVLTQEGRAARDDWEKKREEIEKGLEAASNERAQAEEETAKFRALRWELQEALRAVRNAPSLGV